MAWLKYKETWKKYLPLVCDGCECQGSGIILTSDSKVGKTCNCVIKAKSLYFYSESNIPDNLRSGNTVQIDNKLLDVKSLFIHGPMPNLARYGANLLKEHCKRGHSVTFIDLPVLLTNVRERDYRIKTDVVLIHRIDRYERIDPYNQPLLDSLISSLRYTGKYVILTGEDFITGYAAGYSQSFNLVKV